MSQVVIFSTNGEVLDTCDTLIKIDRKISVFDQFDFLKSIEELFPGLPVGEKLVFDAVEWNEQTKGLYALEFEKVDDLRIQWIILDNTKEQEQVTKVQQSRNESAINEEFLEIQRKYLEMEKSLLDYKNQELNRVQKFKAQFFAEVSHEMRTPLNSISGLIELLKSEKQDSEKYLEALKATSQHLNAIINDVLDLSKIEAGKFELIDKPFELKKSIEQITSGFAMLARDKGIELNVNVDASVPNAIIGDQVRISQVIYNLLGNALKFTTVGSVGLEVKAGLLERDKHNIQFSIADTGSGMSQEDVDKLLEPYAQVEGQDFHQFEGTGLGLGIAQQLIQLMGGALKIESKKGKGTNVSFELTLETTDSSSLTTEASDRPDLSHLNVLFVEDDEISMILLKGIVKDTGLEASFANSIEGFNRTVAETKFDFIVSDINLADGNVLPAFQALQNNAGLNQNTRIIFLSGDDQSAHPALGKLERWSFLLKPIATNHLIKLLARQELSIKINLDNLHASTQGDKALMKEIMSTILETLPLEIERLNQAVKVKNHELAKKTLHKINPSISYLGNSELIAARKSMYAQVAKGQGIETAVLTFSETLSFALKVFEDEKNRF